MLVYHEFHEKVYVAHILMLFPSKIFFAKTYFTVFKSQSKISIEMYKSFIIHIINIEDFLQNMGNVHATKR